MLTTVDNPYSPKDNYDKWKQWDEDNGYNTESFIARLIDSDIDMDDELSMNEAIDNAKQEILDNDVLKVYKLV